MSSYASVFDRFATFTVIDGSNFVKIPAELQQKTLLPIGIKIMCSIYNYTVAYGFNPDAIE